jgi:hypothetical protein
MMDILYVHSEFVYRKRSRKYPNASRARNIRIENSLIKTMKTILSKIVHHTYSYKEHKKGLFIMMHNLI